MVPIQDGQQTRLQVRVVGEPKPKVSWYKAGVQIMPSTDFIIDDFEDGTSVLTIAEVYPDDVGEVVVVAENPLGVVTSTTFLETAGTISLNFLFSYYSSLFLGFKVYLVSLNESKSMSHSCFQDAETIFMPTARVYYNALQSYYTYFYKIVTPT